jgi:hypothetical protein
VLLADPLLDVGAELVMLIEHLGDLGLDAVDDLGLELVDHLLRLPHHLLLHQLHALAVIVKVVVIVQIRGVRVSGRWGTYSSLSDGDHFAEGLVECFFEGGVTRTTQRLLK